MPVEAAWPLFLRSRLARLAGSCWTAAIERLPPAPSSSTPLTRLPTHSAGPLFSRLRYPSLPHKICRSSHSRDGTPVPSCSNRRASKPLALKMFHCSQRNTFIRWSHAAFGFENFSEVRARRPLSAWRKQQNDFPPGESVPLHSHSMNSRSMDWIRVFRRRGSRRFPSKNIYYDRLPRP